MKRFQVNVFDRFSECWGGSGHDDIESAIEMAGKIHCPREGFVNVFDIVERKNVASRQGPEHPVLVSWDASKHTGGE